jgi:hypothetical protein
MALIPVQPSTLVAQLTNILNANFAHLESLVSGLAGGAQKHVTALTAAAGTVQITHNLGSVDVLVQAWDEAGRLAIVDAAVVNANAIAVTFEAAFTGRVIVRL